MAISKYINSLGLEIECGIDNEDYDNLTAYLHEKNLAQYASIGADGSVWVDEKDMSDTEIKFWHENLKIILNFVERLYNKYKIKTNRTCGLHIHIKLKDNELFGIFTFKKFFKAFIKEYVEYFKDSKYLDRLHNNYCVARYTKTDMIRQIQGIRSVRYRAINLVPFRTRKTIEFRIFPHQQNYIEFENTILWFVGTIDKILEKLQKRAVLHSEKLDIPEATVLNFQISHVIESEAIKKKFVIEKIQEKNNIVIKAKKL
jgi:hypothetical protein